MERTLVYGHPYGKSFNAAIKSAIVDLHRNSNSRLKIFDLQEMQFNPVMTQKELLEFSKARTAEGIDIENLDPLAVEMAKEINQSEELILLFPIWWEIMPAQVKGFIDKVIFPGLFYTNIGEFRMKLVSDKLKKVTVITTMNTPGFLYRLKYGNCIKFALINGTFKKIGLKDVRWVNLSAVKFKSHRGRQKYLHRVEAMFPCEDASLNQATTMKGADR